MRDAGVQYAQAAEGPLPREVCLACGGGRGVWASQPASYGGMLGSRRRLKQGRTREQRAGKVQAGGGRRGVP